ncbi:transcription termination factor, mitochondrial-like [Pollicipes pollicipes]|uniref:transcription termination factor, mitochondrial-like n=1 Tax=Pollicipes pollicipes TaxID=41117 RepID=UPI001884F96B|nr:transcription termination factor, mitochondrial-like [Pollicipes pollicipes]
MLRPLRACAALTQRARTLPLWPREWVGGGASYCRLRHSRLCLQLLRPAARHICCAARLRQRTDAPATDASALTTLRDRLGFGSDVELRLFWRRTGCRLDEPRAACSLLVLGTLEREGIGREQVRRFPGLLRITPGRLETNLSAVRRLPAALQDVFPLLALRPGVLAAGVDAICADRGLLPDAASRLDYLAAQLGVGLDRLCPALVTNTSILTGRLERVVEITRLLLDGGILPEAILDDPWIYKHNIDVMRQRLEWLNGVQLRPIRPWMLRSPEHLVRELVNRFQLRKSILSEHDGDLVAYLSERLGLTRDQVAAFERRYPAALRVDVIKLKAVLDELLAQGISGALVDDQPRILCYSVRRIRERCGRMRDAGVPVTTLLVICKTPRDFEQYIAAASGAAKRRPAPPERTAADGEDRTAAGGPER